MDDLKPKLQHVQVPNNMCREHVLEPFDMLVYASIKRFMNKDTKEAYPSLELLKSLTGSGKEKINASISRLNGRYLTVFNRGRHRVYRFDAKYKSFEPFSHEFLDKKDLTNLEKAYIMAVQQFMFKDVQDIGKVSFTPKELSQLINMPEWEIWKHDRELQEKGYLSIIKGKNRDFETGLPRTERVFNLDLLGQKIIWMLARNTERIKQNTEQIRKLEKDLKMMRKLVLQQDKELSKLKRVNIQV